MDVFLCLWGLKKNNTPFSYTCRVSVFLDDGIWKTNGLAYMKLNFRGQ